MRGHTMQREVPETLYYDCPDCDDETIHDVLKGRMGKASLECTLKCTECGRTFATTIPLPKIIKMQVVISDGPVSERTVTEIEEDDIIAVEDEFFLEDLIGFEATILEPATERTFTGEVTDYIDSDINPLFELTIAGREVLVPAVDEMIGGIDFEREQIKFILPEGLID